VFVVALVFFILVPQANASFTKIPMFDLITTSNLPGATDAVYTLHLENPDRSEDALTVSITVPAGYSVNQKFITDKSGIKAGSAYGNCPEGSGRANILTTTTRGHFTISFSGMATVDIVVGEPTPATSGTMEFRFVGTYAILNHGCYGEISTAEGFFVNPSTPGTYAWAPSTATPKSGPTVVMEPRSGFSQIITILGAGATTSATTAETQIPSTTQAVTSTSAQLTTSIPRQTTTTQTRVQMTSSETEMPTTTETPLTGQLPLELIAAGIVVIIIVAAGAVLAFKRRK